VLKVKLACRRQVLAGYAISLILDPVLECLFEIKVTPIMGIVSSDKIPGSLKQLLAVVQYIDIGK
jgi:hypothetical protein